MLHSSHPTPQCYSHTSSEFALSILGKSNLEIGKKVQIDYTHLYDYIWATQYVVCIRCQWLLGILHKSPSVYVIMAA